MNVLVSSFYSVMLIFLRLSSSSNITVPPLLLDLFIVVIKFCRVCSVGLVSICLVVIFSNILLSGKLTHILSKNHDTMEMLSAKRYWRTFILKTPSWSWNAIFFKSYWDLYNIFDLWSFIGFFDFFGDHY